MFWKNGDEVISAGTCPRDRDRRMRLVTFVSAFRRAGQNRQEDRRVVSDAAHSIFGVEEDYRTLENIRKRENVNISKSESRSAG